VPARAREELCVVQVGGRDICVYPLDETLGLLAKKWAVLIVSVLGNRDHARFSELARDLMGISPRTLTDRLRDLEGAGILEREVIPLQPVEVRYGLTPRGLALRKALLPLVAWSAEDSGSAG
jgi:DNA-binding HxlR family transcriptional regulator